MSSVVVLTSMIHLVKDMCFHKLSADNAVLTLLPDMPPLFFLLCLFWAAEPHGTQEDLSIK